MKKNALIVYRMAWAKCGAMMAGAALTAWNTAMDGVEWPECSGTQKAKVIFGCVGAMILVLVAFLDRTISRIESEQQQIPGTPEHTALFGNAHGQSTPLPEPQKPVIVGKPADSIGETKETKQ